VDLGGFVHAHAALIAAGKLFGPTPRPLGGEESMFNIR